jgi:glycosyltransferase involved in cell wall biosynthesis
MSLPAPTPRRRATVVTWLQDEQVGYLDFGYRLKALAEAYALTIVSRRALTEPELKVDATVAIYRPAHKGTLGLAWYWWQAARHLRANPTDLVLHLCSHTAAVANLPLRAPQVVYWNEHPGHYLGSARPMRRWFGALMRALQYRGARRATLVMPIGEAHREDLLAHGCRPARLQVVPMGVADWFSAGSEPATTARVRPLRVVYTGAIHVDRGRDVMIDAVALARRVGVDVQLTLIGANAQQAADCQARAAMQGVSPAVRVFARMPGDQLPLHLAQADFGVCLWADQLHWRFNPPTKLFEYLVAGLPVMASNIRTHTAYLRDGHDGYIFDYDAASLAATFARAWTERERWPALRHSAAARGRPYRWSEIEPLFLDTLGALVR